MMDSEQRQIIKAHRFRLEKSIDYNKLIQLLVEYKMFNRYMWEDIHSISDVLELLPTRGPKAFRDFIQILKKTGYEKEANILEKPTLYLESSDNLFYEMSSIPLGYCLVINNMEFEKEEYREGSDVDADSLKDFFENAGFKVEVKHNMTSDEMHSCLIKFSSKNFSSVNSMILIIMSHGARSKDNREILLGKEANGFIYKNDIYNMFSNKNCETLQSKPKVFFFIACRGKDKDYGVPKSRPKESIDSNAMYIGNDVDDEILPELSDILIINSSPPNKVTVRNHEKGTYFCQALVSVLNEKYKTHDLETIIKLVNQKLEGTVSEILRITPAVHLENTLWKKKIMLCRRD